MDLMCLCLVSVRAMMWGSEWAVSSFCKSRMVVCMPRVFSVRAFRRWCVYIVLLRGGVVCVWELGLISLGFIFSCAWGDFVVSTGGGLGGVGFVSVCVGPEVSSMVVMLRACAVGDGFHALHWDILS